MSWNCLLNVMLMVVNLYLSLTNLNPFAYFLINNHLLMKLRLLYWNFSVRKILFNSVLEFKSFIEFLLWTITPNRYNFYPLVSSLLNLPQIFGCINFLHFCTIWNSETKFSHYSIHVSNHFIRLFFLNIFFLLSEFQ